MSKNVTQLNFENSNLSGGPLFVPIDDVITIYLNLKIKARRVVTCLFAAYFPLETNQMKSSSFDRTGVFRRLLLVHQTQGSDPFALTDCEMTSRHCPSVDARAIDSYKKPGKPAGSASSSYIEIVTIVFVCCFVFFWHQKEKWFHMGVLRSSRLKKIVSSYWSVKWKKAIFGRGAKFCHLIYFFVKLISLNSQQYLNV